MRNEGEYSGHYGNGNGCGCGWPMVLVGAGEIARYLRVHRSTAYTWLSAGRIPARKDGRTRWVTTRTLLDKWILEGAKILREDGVGRKPRREARKVAIGRDDTPMDLSPEERARSRRKRRAREGR